MSVTSSCLDIGKYLEKIQDPNFRNSSTEGALRCSVYASSDKKTYSALITRV